MDKDGFLWQTSQETQEHATAETVITELDFQVNKALEWGVDVTHIDSHMGTIIHSKFIPAYIQAAVKSRVPFMLPRGNASMFHQVGIDQETVSEYAMIISQLEEQGLPLVDGLAMLPLDQPKGQLEIAKKMLNELPSGVTHFLFHPSLNTPELRAIAPDWPSRVANYQTFMDPELKQFIKNHGIQVIGYRHLRNILQNG
jgi:predicted glycoside hydrolase/deacetylase ChbG (UPF0249 family)